jgi:outer membrane protein
MRALGLALAALAALTLPAPAAALPQRDGPLTIEQAVDLAVAQGLRVKASAADARAMDSMRREALAPFWPQLSVNGYWADQTMGPNVYGSAGAPMAANTQVFDARRNRDANVTIMYSLFAGGRDYYGYQAAARRADSAREMHRGTELEAAMQARLDYIAALRGAENLRVTVDMVREVGERLRISRAMFEAGRVPRFYVLRDEAEQANALQMEAMARSRAEQAVVALKTTLGVDLGSSVDLASSLEYVPVTVAGADAVREAVLRHPEVLAATRQREAAEDEVRAAYGSYFPQVAVSAMYDWARTSERGSPAMADRGYSIGVVVSLPVFDGFMRENALRTARARLERARQAEGLARQQVEQEAAQAALMLAAAERSVEASRRGLERAEEEFHVVRERFESGRGIHLEILDGQVSLTRARFNTVAALAEYHSAVAMWLKAAGRIR